MSRRASMLLAIAAIMASAPAQAHHSFAAFFDSGKMIKLTGKVMEFRFTNPHGLIAIEVAKPDGQIEIWRAETNAPVVLMRRGWTRTIIKPGDIVTMEGWGSRDGKPYLRLRQVLDAAGKPIGAAPFSTSDDK